MSFFREVFSNILNYAKRLSVAKAICYSFLFAILAGGVLLYLLEHGKLSMMNAIYLSASAFCVTGLSPIPLSDLNIFSQIALLVYIQAGGLGIIVMTFLVGILLISGLSRNTKLQEFIKEVLDSDIKDHRSTQDQEFPKIWRVVMSIFNISITIELIGAFFLYLLLPEEIPSKATSRIFVSIFTSISAFNNAGFSITDDLAFLTGHPGPLYVIMILIVMGGIGFPVIIFIEKLMLQSINRITSRFEIWCETHLLTKTIKGEEPSPIYYFLTRISVWTEYRIESYNKSLMGESNKVQTQIILLGTIFLIFIGAFLFFLIEQYNPKTLSSLSFHGKVSNSLLMSICARTAGFNTFGLDGMHDPAVVLICVLMFIGGGPQGTAGGIKITTFVILIQYLRNVISSKSTVEVFGYTVSKRSVAMSIRLYFLATIYLAFIVFLLTLIQTNHFPMHQTFFEVISAFGTVGFSLGITPSINDLEKVIFIIVMFTGRIGIFTVLIAITGNPATIQNMGKEDEDLKIQVG